MRELFHFLLFVKEWTCMNRVNVMMRGWFRFLLFVNWVNSDARVIQWTMMWEWVFSLDHGAVSVWPQTLAKQPLPLRSWPTVSWVDFALMCAEIWRTWFQECDEVRSSKTADGTGVPLSALLWSHQGRLCFSPWMWVYLVEGKRTEQNIFGLRSSGGVWDGMSVCACLTMSVLVYITIACMHIYILHVIEYVLYASRL